MNHIIKIRHKETKEVIDAGIEWFNCNTRWYEKVENTEGNSPQIPLETKVIKRKKKT